MARADAAPVQMEGRRDRCAGRIRSLHVGGIEGPADLPGFCRNCASSRAPAITLPTLGCDSGEPTAVLAYR